MASKKINKKLNRCKLIDLGMHPYADSFISKNQLNYSEPVYPLQCYLNLNTGIISNSLKTNDDERYNLYDYSYTSSNSKYARNYWRSYYKDISKYINITDKSKILEIGSNDGFLLSLFKKKTNKVLGVDASSKMCEIANKKKVKTLNYIMGEITSKKILRKNGKFDLIIANNVINHANDLSDFINGVKKIMHKKSVFVYEVPYWLDLVKQKKFDQIYHEHINYFTAKSSFNVLKKNGLILYKINKTSYHGGSIRVFSKLKSKNYKYSTNIELSRMINLEEKLKLFEKKTYIKFMKTIHKKKIKLLKSILNYKSKGYKIVGIGAAAKANTFINYIGLNSLIVDFVTDSSKHKVGKFTPLSRIPIYKDEKLKNLNKVCAILFAWNISNILKEKIKKINNKVIFLNF
jgi:SAM-dependent methyltransferase